MDAPTKAFFAAQMTGANSLCFDCGQRDPQWASCNNGIYFCLDCSGRHRSIGCHLSFVRCIWMDAWKPLQLMMMKEGGNDRLAAYLDEHGPKDWRKLPITQKYDIPACAKYRALLREKVDAACAAGTPLFEPAKKAVSTTHTVPPTKAFNPFDSDLFAEKPADAPAEVPVPVKPKTRTLPANMSTITDFFSDFTLDIVKEADQIVDSLVGPSPLPPKTTESTKAVKPVPSSKPPAEAQTGAAGYAAKPVQQKGQPLVDLSEMTLEAPPAAPAVDVWGDDFWD